MSESTVTFRHEMNHSYKLNGVKHTIKESLIDGAKGLSFMFLKKVGDSDFYKVYAKEENGKYKVQEVKGDKTTDSELTEAEVKKMLKANKELEFVLNFMEKERGKYKGKLRGKALRGGADEPGLFEELPAEEGQLEELSQQDGGAKKKRSKKSKKSKKSSKKMSGGAKKKSKKTSKKSKKSSKKSKKSSKKSKKSSKKMSGGGKKKSKKSKKSSKKSKKTSKKRSKKSSKKMSGGAKKKSKKTSKKSKKSSKKSKKSSKKTRK